MAKAISTNIISEPYYPNSYDTLWFKGVKFAEEQTALGEPEEFVCNRLMFLTPFDRGILDYFSHLKRITFLRTPL